MTTPTFGERLRARRHELDLSQEVTARKAHTTERTVRRLETGAAQPSWAMVQRLSKALDVPVTYWNTKGKTR